MFDLHVVSTFHQSIHIPEVMCLGELSHTLLHFLTQFSELVVVVVVVCFVGGGGGGGLT